MSKFPEWDRQTALIFCSSLVYSASHSVWAGIGAFIISIAVGMLHTVVERQGERCKKALSFVALPFRRAGMGLVLSLVGRLAICAGLVFLACFGGVDPVWILVCAGGVFVLALGTLFEIVTQPAKKAEG